MRLVLKDLGADHEWITWHSPVLFVSVMIDLGMVGVGEFRTGVSGRNDAIMIMKKSRGPASLQESFFSLPTRFRFAHFLDLSLTLTKIKQIYIYFILLLHSVRTKLYIYNF